MLKEDVSRVLQDAVKKGYVAGASVLLIQDGKEVLYEEAGYRDVENKVPMKRDTIARLYSMSKPVTAAAVMILAERGMIDLLDDVSLYLPGFDSHKVEENGKLVDAKRGIRIRDLLNMTSGCVYPGDQTIAGKASAELFDKIGERLYTQQPMTTIEIASKIGKLPAQFQPGEHWQYGTSADVLGALVEAVSNMSFGEFLEKEIFEPLGMSDTGFYVPKEKQERLSKVYEVTETGLKECVTNHLGIRYLMDEKPAFESGGAGLASTLDDYAKFTQMLLNGGSYAGKTILRPATVAYMCNAQLMDWQQADFDWGWDSLNGFSYGNLMRVMKNEGQAYTLGSVGEYGWDGWLGPYFTNSPKDDLTILLFMQKKDSGTNQLTRQLRNVIYSYLKK